jgi:endo-1,4-beta-D-glucanase Y
VVFLAMFSFFSFINASERYPFPQHLKYVKGSISPKASKDKDITDFYDYWKKNYLIKVEKDQYRIATKKRGDRTVSEAQGYGMIITAIMAGYDKEAKSIFDGLWRFSRVHRSAISKDLMAWEVPEVVGENDSAFDGDADIAYALLLADKQWGSREVVDYAKEVKIVLDAIYEYTIGKDSYLPLLGDWVEQNGTKYNQYRVRSSDFMIGHFKAFYRFSHDKRWLKVDSASKEAMLEFQKSISKDTGLVSDFLEYKNSQISLVDAEFLEGHDDSYYYNACRLPWRVGIDVLLNSDADSLKIVRKISNWIEKKSNKKAKNIKSGFSVEGKVIGNYFSTVFAAPFAVAAMSNPSQQEWIDSIYEVIKDHKEDYFEDSVNLLSLLVLNRNFWDATTIK